MRKSIRPSQVLDLKEIDERFWKTVEWEKRLYEANRKVPLWTKLLRTIGIK